MVLFLSPEALETIFPKRGLQDPIGFDELAETCLCIASDMEGHRNIIGKHRKVIWIFEAFVVFLNFYSNFMEISVILFCFNLSL